MKMNLFSNLRLMADAPPGGNGSGDKTPGADAGEKKDRALKKGHVLVRNATAQPLAVDGILLEPRVLGKDGKVTKEAPAVAMPEKHLERLGTLVTKVATLLAFLIIGANVTFAQQYAPTASTVYFAGTNGLALNGGTNTLAANTTNTYNTKVALTKYDEGSLEISFAYTGAGTGVQTFNFVPSNDGTLKATTGQTYSFTIAGNGTTTVDLITNLYIGAPGYLVLTTGANTNATLVNTNLLIRFVPKPSRRGT